MPNSLRPECTDLQLGGMNLKWGLHYQSAPDGIALVKSGHLALHQHILRSPDPRRMNGQIIARIICDPTFSESTFSGRNRPSSILKSLSKRHGVAPSCVRILQRYLDQAEPWIARRSAELLLHLLEEAHLFPDLRTLLHCYFRTGWPRPHWFATFIRYRLQKATGKAAFARECNKLQAAFDRFTADFRPLVGTIDSDRMSTDEKYSAEVNELATRFAMQIKLRLEEL